MTAANVFGAARVEPSELVGVSRFSVFFSFCPETLWNDTPAGLSTGHHPGRIFISTYSIFGTSFIVYCQYDHEPADNNLLAFVRTTVIATQ